MHGFLFAHLAEYAAAALVSCGESLQVFVEMFHDLPFSFLDEPESPAITGNPAQRADRVTTRIPCRIQSTRARPEFRESGTAPRKMIELLVSRVLQFRVQLAVARNQRMALIQTLGCDLACIVNAHQVAGQSLFLIGQG